jgi:LruC domain-containing protein
MKLNLTNRAIGASNKNGFAFQLDNLAPSKITSVSGTQSTNASWVSNTGNGTENGQTYANVIVFDDAFKVLPSPGGSGVNVDLNFPYVTPTEMNITVAFKTASGEAIGLNDINFNPYIIINQERGREVHLADFTPSTKANQELFGTDDDDSNKGLGKMVSLKYYKTKNNLPWALSIEGEVPYPTEKTDILGAYLHLAEWAESNGSIYTDWYANGVGYRNNTKLYIRP